MALYGGTVTLLQIDAKMWHFNERRVMRMMTIDIFIGIVGLVLTAFGLGYTIGSRKQK